MALTVPRSGRVSWKAPAHSARTCLKSRSVPGWRTHCLPASCKSQHGGHCLSCKQPAQRRCPCRLACRGHGSWILSPTSCQPLGRAWAGQPAGSVVKSALSAGAAHSHFALAETGAPMCQAIVGASPEPGRRVELGRRPLPCGPASCSAGECSELTPEAQGPQASRAEGGPAIRGPK